jgi:hypothetical protein
MNPRQPIATDTLNVKETDGMKRLRYTAGVVLLVLSAAAVAPAHASDESDIKAVIAKWGDGLQQG